MIFAILFVIAFFVSLAAYLLTGKWLVAMLITVSLFVLNTLVDSAQNEATLFTLMLGLPLVCFASLLGAYVVELRRGFGVDEQLNSDRGSETSESGPESGDSASQGHRD